MQHNSDQSVPERTLENRNVADLKLHEHHSVFADPTEAEITLLAQSICDRGLQTPLDVLPDGTIIGGRKRWMALVEMGYEECQCWVRHDLAAQGESAVVQHLVFDNIERRQLSALEVARAYQLAKSTYVPALDGEPRDMRDVLAEQFGQSGGSLDRLVRILRAPRNVQDAFDHRKLRLVDAAKVGQLSPADQDAISSEIYYGGVPQEVVDRYLGRPQPRQTGGPVGKQVTAAEQARRDLVAAVGALEKAYDAGDKLSPARRVSVSDMVRRLRVYLQQRA